MHWLGHWEICGKRECRDRETVAQPRDRFSARQWLQQLETDVDKMRTMRALLWQESSAWPLSTISDEEIIDQIAGLLIAGRLHIHAKPAQPASAPTSGVSETPGIVPFPLSERQPRQPVVAYSAPVSDPPTFTPDMDAGAQAAALVAAAAAGKPFCPE